MKRNSPIRILQVLGQLNIGGAETYIMNIYRDIDRTKVQFDFVVHGNEIGFYEGEIKKMGGKIFRIPRYKLYNHFQYKKAWNNLFKNNTEYRIIHSHIRSTASIILKIAKKYGLRTICHSHSTSNGSGISSIIKHKFQKSIPKYADYLFACSKESAIWLYGKELANSNKCYIINNAIDSKKYIFNNNIRNKVRKKFNIQDKIVIGQVGRLAEVKNYGFTIKLLKKLTDINKNFYLLIIGTGSLKNKIKEQIKNDNLEKNVLILENRSDVNELMQGMDIYIMPSLWEGLPLALVEAQAAGLHCVISNNVSDGILVKDLVTSIELDNINNWIDKINELSSLKQKRIDCSESIINNGFDVEKNAKMISEFYLNIIRQLRIKEEV